MSEKPTTTEIRRPFVPFLRDECGTAMLEFVLIAPLLCFLTTGILYFRHHIDYAQDSVVRFRRLTWQYARPDNARDASGGSSDTDGFGLMSDVRTAVFIVGVSSDFQALERYHNGVTGVPYDTLTLNVENYMDEFEPMADMPEDPWVKTLGNLGKWFGTRIGGGVYVAPDGLKVGWKERHPMPVDPWQRTFSGDLDPANYILDGLVLRFLDPNTLFRCPVPRIDLRGDLDIGQNPKFGADENETLSLEEESGSSRIWNIVK